MKVCKEARDFLGCAKAFSDEPASVKQEKANNPEQCNDEGWCTANAGNDVFGLPKVVGWEYKILDNGIHYVSPKYYKIKHKGRSNRYLARKYVWHYYQEATPATSGYYKTVSSGKENVVITPMDHITVTPLHQKEFGFLVSLDGPEDLGLPIAPGLMIVRIKHLLTTTAENLKVNGKRVERLMNASKLMSSHV